MLLPPLEDQKLLYEIELLKVQARREESQCVANAAQARWSDLQAAATEMKNFRDAHSAVESGDFLYAGGVDADGVEAYMGALTHFHDRHPAGDIRLRINSPGGSIVQGFALFDLLQELKRDHQIETVAYGLVASMGGILFQAGHRRIASPHAHMLIHEGSLSFQGAAGQVADTVAFGKTLQAQCLDILAERSTLSKEEIGKRWERRDWWIDSAQMVEFGFADEVMGL